MDPSRLKEKIIISRYTETKDQYHEPIKTWTTLKTPWAEVRSIRGSERFSVSREISENVKLFLVRWECVQGVNVKDRITYRDADYDITGIAEIGFKEIVEFTAQLVQ